MQLYELKVNTTKNTNEILQNVTQPQQKGYLVPLVDVNQLSVIFSDFLFHFHNWKLKLKLQVKPNNFTDTKLIKELNWIKLKFCQSKSKYKNYYIIFVVQNANNYYVTSELSVKALFNCNTQNKKTL